MTGDELKQLAFRFVLAVGIVNLFADMTYEGARANTGPFLGSLGASAAVVGLVAGTGELLGYGLRSVSGYFADKTHNYWAVIFLGYFINMLSVPALAFAASWPAAAAFIIAERTGRAIRKPAVEAMLSHAGKSIGHGWVFGLNEALDQGGATAGPLITAWVLRGSSYHAAFAALLAPALMCLIMLVVTRVAYPRPQELEQRAPHFLESRGFSRQYWTYVIAGALIACGFSDFSLIAFHFRKADMIRPETIPVFYAAAMASAALAAPIIGRMLDKVGRPVLVAAFTFPAVSAPLVFLGGSSAALAGVILWGLGLAAQDATLKAALARVVPGAKRSTAFGLFDTCFGVAWFLGSATMGLLYEHSLLALVVFSSGLQLAALPVLWSANGLGRS